jgi:hypothetical protein
MQVPSLRRSFTVGVFASAVILPLWVWSFGGWLHPELIPVTESVWSPAHDQSVWQQLRTTLFDWKLFESTAFRMRPLSDFVEVVDAIVRPWKLFGFHASLTLSALAFAASTAGVFYAALVRSGSDRLRAAIWMLFLVTSVGYLSCFVPYIRPAKKLALLFSSLTLLECSRYRATRRGFFGLYVSVFLAFFSDEAGFALWPIACVLVGPLLTREKRWVKAAILAVLPALYFTAVKCAVPLMYSSVGVPRRMQMGVVGSLLEYLKSPRFYVIAAHDLASALWATFGSIGARPWLCAVVLAALACAIGASLWSRRWWNLGLLLAVIGMSFSLSLFDWYNTPFNSNAFGAITFYYHSPVAIFAVFALAQYRVPMSALVVLVGVGVCLNLSDFGTINRIAMIMHTYPIEVRALPADVEKPEALASEFHTLLVRLNGQHADWYEKTFTYYEGHPMGGAAYVQRFDHMFHPR